MLDESSRSAALRRPQSGTPPTISLGVPVRTELVGDANLAYEGLRSPGAMVLCGLLLRVQIRTYKRTGHIISYADEYVMRKIRNHAKRATLPNCYARCMRCNCPALLIDWCAAVELADDPLMASRRFDPAGHIPVDKAFFAECKGNEKAQEASILLD
jgi:hypothetical protein